MSEPTYPCPKCQAGLLHLRYVTYIDYLGQELLTVPNFPAWACDVCGYLEYDERALGYLRTLLSPWLQEQSEPRPPRRRPPRRSPTT